MSNLDQKVKAIRLLRHLRQENTAYQAHINLKSYQRKETGTSPISDQELAQLSVPFQCSIDDIRNFDLENNSFSKAVTGHVQALEVENKLLKSELNFHRQLYNKLVAAFEALVNRGAGQHEP